MGQWNISRESHPFKFDFFLSLVEVKFTWMFLMVMSRCKMLLFELEVKLFKPYPIKPRFTTTRKKTWVAFINTNSLEVGNTVLNSSITNLLTVTYTKHINVFDFNPYVFSLFSFEFNLWNRVEIWNMLSDSNSIFIFAFSDFNKSFTLRNFSEATFSMLRWITEVSFVKLTSKIIKVNARYRLFICFVGDYRIYIPCIYNSFELSSAAFFRKWFDLN